MPVKKVIKKKIISKKSLPVSDPKETSDHQEAALVQGKGSRKGRYFYAVGRRKSSVAQIRLQVGKGIILINSKPYDQYFKNFALLKMVKDAQVCIGRQDGFDITIKVKGGGINGQAEAARHGISRALVLFELNFRKKLKKAGYLKRDPRVKERKKPGLKRARRAPQFSKR